MQKIGQTILKACSGDSWQYCELRNKCRFGNCSPVLCYFANIDHVVQAKPLRHAIFHYVNTPWGLVFTQGIKELVPYQSRINITNQINVHFKKYLEGILELTFLSLCVPPSALLPGSEEAEICSDDTLDCESR